jgi:hypothetical protein
MIADFLSTYPYFVESVALLLLAGVTLLLLPRHRSTLLASGLLCLPGAAISSLHVPAYWNPTFTAYWIAGPEDIIWVFSVGITVWFLAALPFARYIETTPLRRSIVPRSLLCYALAGILLAVARIVIPGDDNIMYATLAPMAALAAILAIVRRDFLPLAATGGIGYTLFHFLDVYAFSHIWPQTVTYWTPEAHLPLTIFRVPAMELIWACVFGSLWPLMVAFVCDVRWRPQECAHRPVNSPTSTSQTKSNASERSAARPCPVDP